MSFFPFCINTFEKRIRYHYNVFATYRFTFSTKYWATNYIYLLVFFSPPSACSFDLFPSACIKFMVLRTNIADLSSFVMGAIPLSAFLWTGRMTCSDRSYEQDIQNALGWSRKPKNYTYF